MSDSFIDYEAWIKRIEEEQKQMSLFKQFPYAVIPNFESRESNKECNHEWKFRELFTSTEKYCIKCDKFEKI